VWSIHVETTSRSHSGLVWLQKRPVTIPKIRPTWRGYCALCGITIAKKEEAFISHNTCGIIPLMGRSTCWLIESGEFSMIG
jgi:hypothetical protein